VEDLLKKLIEQNDALIAIGERTVSAIEDLRDDITSELNSITSQLTVMDSSSDVVTILSTLRDVSEDIQSVAAALKSR
jgi:hypothetical protein